ncbi:GNAT family N-acetyltransferase [Paenibacillus lactis]|nr:GNAT family N-acetyltransferase [Paenibacillus lactis]
MITYEAIRGRGVVEESGSYNKKIFAHVTEVKMEELNMEVVRSTDSSTIARLNKAVHDLHYSLFPEYFKAYNYEEINQFFQKLMADNTSNHYFYLLHESGQALGYILFEIKQYHESAFKKSFKSIYVHQLSIIKESQSKGLGTLLMDKVCEFALEHGIPKIELDYWVNNETAGRFYHKQGFKKYREFLYKDLT